MTVVVFGCTIRTMTHRIQTAFFTLSIACTLLIMTLIVLHRLDNANEYTCQTASAQIEGYGDTVWDVVARNCEGNLNAAVHDTLNLEGNSTIVQPWQWIILPTDP